MSLRFKIDTGADEAVISSHTYQQLFHQYKLRTCLKRLCGPDDTHLKVKGTLCLRTTAFGKSTLQNLFVIKGIKNILVGRPAIDALRLFFAALPLRSKAVVTTVSNTHDWTWAYSEYELELQQNAMPLALTSPRRVPLPLCNKMKENLNRMQQLDVITPVEEPTK